MTKHLSTVALIALLAACSGSNPFDDDTGGDPDPTPPPAPEEPALSTTGDLRAAAYNAEEGTLSVTISLDGDETLQVYDADGGFLGYTRFRQQDDPLDRYFTAFAQTSADGSLTAVVAMDGGQFNRYFGGTSLTQNEVTLPETGLASYAGNYVGLLNLDRRDEPVDVGDSRQPGASQQVLARIFFNVEFGENNINGIIYDRTRYAIDPLSTEAELVTQAEADADPADGITDADVNVVIMDPVYLIVTGIDAQGFFSGTAEDGELSGIGSYEGYIGGTGGAFVAGGVNLTGDFIGDFENEEEYGIFLLGLCDGTATIPECAGAEAGDE